MSYNNPNKFAQDAQRRAPAGWKVNNLLFQTLLTQATRTGHHPLIDRVRQMEHGPRRHVVLVMNTVARAAKGEIAPESVDIDAILRGEK